RQRSGARAPAVSCRIAGPPAPHRYPLPLHAALPISEPLTTELRLTTQRLLRDHRVRPGRTRVDLVVDQVVQLQDVEVADRDRVRSEEHTSELQSREDLVCRLLLGKKNRQAELGEVPA